jgi:hypothetical protein
VRKIVDQLGGLNIDVPYEIWDTQFPTEDNRYMTVHFPAGPQLMNGEQVLQYVRTRHGSSDFDRMARQQQVIEATRQRITTVDFLPKVPGFLLTARDCVHTDLTVSEMIGLWTDFGGISRENIHLSVIDSTLAYPWTTSAGAAVLLPDQPAIRQLVRDMGMADDGPRQELARGLQVRLFSNSGEDGQFATAANALAGAGYTIYQGGVRDNPSGHTVVLDYSEGGEGMQLAEALGLTAQQVLRQPKPTGLPEMLVADIMLWAARS